MSAHGIEYRDYQLEARDAGLKALIEDGHESALIVMPTGTGKTVVGGMYAESFKAQGRRTLFLAHREVLLQQAYDTVSRFGFETAMEMGRNNALDYRATVGDPDVVVGSVQSLQADRLMRWPTDYFGLIIIDECHRALADSYTKILNWFEGYRLLGITATPSRGDRRNLGSRFEVKAFEYSLRNAIKDRWIKPIRVRTCPLKIDLRGISLSGGDFSLGELVERIGPNLEILGRALAQEMGGRPAVVFTRDVGSAMAMADVLDQLGVRARWVAGDGGKFPMPRAERKANLAAFDAGEYQAIVCCELLIEGWDSKRVECVGICRPTLQQYRYSQMVGRGTRKYSSEDSRTCLVLDFDWETDPEVKNLCTSVSLFDDEQLDEEVYAEARQIAAERAVDVDPIEVIEEAEKRFLTRARLSIRLTGKEAKYAAWEHDPVGVSKILDIKLNRRYDLDKQGTNPATQAQIHKLRTLGITAPEGLSKWGASRVIDKILKRKSKGLASHAQVHTLISSGVDLGIARAMTVAEASGAIEEIKSLVPQTQKTLF